MEYEAQTSYYLDTTWVVQGGAGVAAGNKPGPGAYEAVAIVRADGKHFLSKLRDSGSGAMISSAPRFFSDSARVPGPGHYEHPVPVNPEGRNFISRFRTSFSRSFGQAKRKFELNNKFGILPSYS